MAHVHSPQITPMLDSRVSGFYAVSIGNRQRVYTVKRTFTATMSSYMQQMGTSGRFAG
jgi:hypothetical protein